MVSGLRRAAGWQAERQSRGPGSGPSSGLSALGLSWVPTAQREKVKWPGLLEKEFFT